MFEALVYATFMCIVGAITAKASDMIHQDRCKPTFGNGYFEKHPAYCIWMAFIACATFIAAVSFLGLGWSASHDPNHPQDHTEYVE